MDLARLALIPGFNHHSILEVAWPWKMASGEEQVERCKDPTGSTRPWGLEMEGAQEGGSTARSESIWLSVTAQQIIH